MPFQDVDKPESRPYIETMGLVRITSGLGIFT